MKKTKRYGRVAARPVILLNIESGRLSLLCEAGQQERKRDPGSQAIRRRPNPSLVPPLGLQAHTSELGEEQAGSRVFKLCRALLVFRGGTKRGGIGTA